MSPQHIVRSFDLELERLASEIADMGQAALAQVERARQALQQFDRPLARQVIADDDAIDAREREVSHDVLRLLALRQPNARDLREVLAALRIAADIERIGDHAVGMARLSLALPDDRTPLPASIHVLGQLTSAMVGDVLDAWRRGDADAARAVWRRDDEVDRVHGVLFAQMLQRLLGAGDAAATPLHLLLVAKHLERIGDHATNIAEQVWFVAEGAPGAAAPAQDAAAARPR
ncbi:MAG: phosphate signaling complex protein PhoU [Dokdonella sp.]|uniref:phosphate signaling complex protein PhoU n=1 Tax=Dokdonella sp. TaxID=2291710 RepID=UPI0025BEB40B|nr:phosphate signaling complex protein PhoU [Dokdonella sp.]MBX3701878.1 phosphate signaling complex protein PhoU [Dokdonella sp.]